MRPASTESSPSSAPQRLPHAGVHFPPPFVYLGGLVLGWLVERARALPITHGPGSGASTVRLSVAALFAFAWLAVMLTALSAFRRAHTTLIPNRPASAFVTDGPYRWTRNPMYVSMTLLYLAVALWMNSWWPVLLLVLVLVIIQELVITREERYLISAFPDQYVAYSARVRRWI
nr:isoprenylcysteine carboxylmethyltransferase family protein [uncultured bacterium]